MRAPDWRLVVLFAIAVLFLQGALQKKVNAERQQIVMVQGNFLDFNYKQVFNMPDVIDLPNGEEPCSEKASLPYHSRAL